MANVHRYVKGKGFTDGMSHEFKQNTDKNIQPTDISKIKGLFGRKTVMVEWENTDTGETVYIPIKQLLPGQVRLISEKVYTEPGFDILSNSDGELTDQDKAELYKILGVSTEGELLRVIRKQSVELLLESLLVDIDEEWLMEEATDDFLNTLRAAALGTPPVQKGEDPEDNSVSTFPEVDTESEE